MRASCLAQMSALLSSSLDYERALPRLVRLALPVLADLCAIDLLMPDGTINRAACAHVDPTKEALAYEMRARHGFNPSSPSGVPAAIQSRRSVLMRQVTESDLTVAAQNADQLNIFHQLGPKSWIIVRNAQAQTRLVDDLLDLSTVISGRMRLSVQAVDLGEVIGASLETVGPAAEAKGIRLQSVLDSPGTPVSGDPARLQQVVWNLLSNAVKFTPKGGRVQVKLQQVRSHVEIIVSDSGEGIRA